MYIHTFLYQSWDKHSSLNPQYQYKIFWLLFLLIISYDLLAIYTKYNSITTKYSKLDHITFHCILPILLYILQYLLLYNIHISGYTRTFCFVKNIFLLMNVIKIIFIFHKLQFIAELIKFIDIIWIINILLIALTDPEVNTPEKNNLIVFYEIYFRYLEFHLLMLTYAVVQGYNNIDIESKQKLYTTGVVIGKFDSFRIIVILIFAQFYFSLINGIAYSFKYWLGFTTIIPVISCVKAFREKKFHKGFVFLIISSFWNLGCYVLALYLSAPNVGDGSEKS